MQKSVSHKNVDKELFLIKHRFRKYYYIFVSTESFFSYPDFFGSDTEIGVRAQQIGRQSVALANLGGQQQAHGAQQLKLLSRNGALAEESVHIVDCQRKDLLFASLFVAHL